MSRPPATISLTPRYGTLLSLAALMILAPPLASADAPACEAESGNTTVALLELYTSEGCSSCPPADEWIATLRSKGFTPDRVVPLALHVDYWDNLGWEDPFAKQLFTQRQYQYARINNTRTVYTPQVVLSGREQSGWRNRAESAIERLNRNPARANVKLSLARDKNVVTIKSDATAKNHPGRAELFVAIYENNLVRRIGTGENAGRTLRHHYVVHELFGPVTSDANGVAHITQQVRAEKSWDQNELGFAAFVQDRDSGEILQALALPLCR